MEELVGEKAPGPSPTFSVVHLVRALELIAEKPVGRGRLSRELALGEGATRTLIERLKDADLISVDQEGCILSKRGEKLWGSLHTNFPKKVALEKSGLTLASFNVARLVKGCGHKVKLGMEQRDAALMAGAKGATTLVFKDGKLTVPPEQRDVAEDFPIIYRELMNKLKPEEDDAVVIGSADTLEKAEYGALAAALSLLNSRSAASR